jgi:hypothetical protein
VAAKEIREQRNFALAVRAPVRDEQDQLGLSRSGDVDRSPVEARSMELGNDRTDGGIRTAGQGRERVAGHLDFPVFVTATSVLGRATREPATMRTMRLSARINSPAR